MLIRWRRRGPRANSTEAIFLMDKSRPTKIGQPVRDSTSRLILSTASWTLMAPIIAVRPAGAKGVRGSDPITPSSTHASGSDEIRAGTWGGRTMTLRDRLSDARVIMVDQVANLTLVWKGGHGIHAY